jgi:2-polyprenyl-6-methoxyphenol hydroxylase-like FAD-dependent oxidoreductase
MPARFRDMSWSSWFRINSRMVSRLKVGRLLLGGDAAHIHSPAGAQGMNTGIQDMINLAWKLALVLNGQAPPQLLDTYEQERLPVMRDELTKTERLTDVIVRPVGWRVLGEARRLCRVRRRRARIGRASRCVLPPVADRARASPRSC